MRQTSLTRAVLREQATAFQQQFPELYEHLRRRDAELLRLARLPSPADIELSATLNVRGRLERVRQALERGGIASLHA